MSIQADITFERELWETAVTLRGTVAPGDYKHYVLPLLFLRYLSLGYEQRHQQLELLLKDQRSEYYTGDPAVVQTLRVSRLELATWQRATTARTENSFQDEKPEGSDGRRASDSPDPSGFPPRTRDRANGDSGSNRQLVPGRETRRV